MKEKQFGFRNEHSMALAKDRLIICLEKRINIIIVLVFLDLLKVFYITDHKILL